MQTIIDSQIYLWEYDNDNSKKIRLKKERTYNSQIDPGYTGLS